MPLALQAARLGSACANAWRRQRLPRWHLVESTLNGEELRTPTLFSVLFNVVSRQCAFNRIGVVAIRVKSGMYLHHEVADQSEPRQRGREQQVLRTLDIHLE